MAVGQNQWYHFGVGEFTTHFRTYVSGWIGMFTGGTGFNAWPYDFCSTPPEARLKKYVASPG